MNRSKYFDAIESKLSLLATRIEIRGRLNILDLHLHSENFYLHFFNLLFEWELQNLNVTDQNAAGIDLVDREKKVIIQVSSTATKHKIESALTKNLSIYQGYSFKFISISKDASDLKTKEFLNPHNLVFVPINDIFDIPSLLRLIAAKEIDQQKDVCEFLERELNIDPDPRRVESNLATIIKILSKENWSQDALGYEHIPYDIDAKISYNQLDSAKTFIDDYKIHYSRIDKIYSDFDKLGANKSLSILNGIRSIYIDLGSVTSPDERFFETIKNVIQRIHKSANYTSMPEEELELSVQILVVDAFIRCKIFKNPLGKTDAHS